MAQVFPFERGKANTQHPFNPFTPAERFQGESPARAAKAAQGDPDDTAYYVAIPGANFLRPWLAVPNGPAFIWPLGLEGFSLSIDPKLGIHSFIGDNAVKVDVMHKGEERFSMSGNLIGESSVDAFRRLRDVVYADTPEGGKLLYIPHLMSHVQRMVIANARFDRGEDERGKDLTYSIEFVRIGIANKADDPKLVDLITQPSPTKTGNTTTAKLFKTTSKYNTLRKIALLKYKSAANWRSLYNLNEKTFRKLGVPAMKAPDYKLKLGTAIYYR
jgi:hypothetical protein